MISEQANKRLGETLRSWLNTPHAHGASTRGRGVDCRYFVVKVLDELYGIDLPLPPRMNPHMALGDPAKAFEIVRDVIQRYPHEIIKKEMKPESGDVIITQGINLGNQDAGPSHVLIMGDEPNFAWHSSSPSGVCKTGIGYMKKFIVRVYRPLETERWINADPS